MGHDSSLVPGLSESVFVNGSGFTIVPGWKDFAVVFFNGLSKEVEKALTFFSPAFVILDDNLGRFSNEEGEEVDIFSRSYFEDEKVHYECVELLFGFLQSRTFQFSVMMLLIILNTGELTMLEVTNVRMWDSLGFKVLFGMRGFTTIFHFVSQYFNFTSLHILVTRSTSRNYKNFWLRSFTYSHKNTEYVHQNSNLLELWYYMIRGMRTALYRYHRFYYLFLLDL